jgi:hypothetical protein
VSPSSDSDVGPSALREVLLDRYGARLISHVRRDHVADYARAALVFASEDACYIEQQALPGGCPKAMSAIREQFDPGVPKSVRIAFDVSPGDRPTSLVVAGSQLAIPP